MADFRLSVYVAKRGEGKSATAMAAYRAAEKIQDRRTGEMLDYSRKQGVLHSEIIAPAGAPDWATDRQELWNRSEAAHKVQKAVVAREIQLSLPHELSDGQRKELTTEFVRFFAEYYKVAVDMCIHAPSRHGDERNYHAHLLICTRPFDASKKEGLGNNVRAFDAIACQRGGTNNEVELWRSTWAQMMNGALERAEVRTAEGVTVTVDHRSYKRQGIEQEPTIKEGPAATAKKRAGEQSDRADQNDEIRERNKESAQLAEEVKAIAQELDILRRREAELLTATQAGEKFFVEKESSTFIEPTRRHGENWTTEQHERGLASSIYDPNNIRQDYQKMPWETPQQAANRAARAALDVANDNDNFGLKKASWETEKQFQGRVQRAAQAQETGAAPSDENKLITRNAQNITALHAERELVGTGENLPPEKLPSESAEKYSERFKQWSEYQRAERQAQIDDADYQKNLNPQRSPRM